MSAGALACFHGGPSARGGDTLAVLATVPCVNVRESRLDSTVVVCHDSPRYCVHIFRFFSKFRGIQQAGQPVLGDGPWNTSHPTQCFALPSTQHVFMVERKNQELPSVTKRSRAWVQKSIAPNDAALLNPTWHQLTAPNAAQFDDLDRTTITVQRFVRYVLGFLRFQMDKSEAETPKAMADFGWELREALLQILMLQQKKPKGQFRIATFVAALVEHFSRPNATVVLVRCLPGPCAGKPG